MAVYLLGDLQGCAAALARLLEKIDFSPSRDTLFVLGDLVNRGPDSLATLRRLMALGNAAQCLLGNHDLHALAVWKGLRPAGKHDTLQALLQAPDSALLLDWLRHRPLAQQVRGWLLVHAGVLPQWDVAQTLALADEVAQALRGPDWVDFLATMYGNSPMQWQDSLRGAERLRVIVNALTRLRFCTPAGAMEFAHSQGADQAPPGYLPWFAVPGRRTEGIPIVFGHWSTLVNDSSATDHGLRYGTLALDTGCVWGGCLTAARLDERRSDSAPGFELIQVPCEQAQSPRR